MSVENELREATPQMLPDLLAVIHRDGRHRQAEVGIEQAWMEAMMMVPYMLDAQAERAAALAERDKLREALVDIAHAVRIGSSTDLRSWQSLADACQLVARTALGETNAD